MSPSFTLRISSGTRFCSGVLISPDLGAAEHARTEYVLTCAHFFRGKTGPFKVGGAHFTATVLGAVTIPWSDLAVVRLDKAAPPKDLLPVATRRARLLAPAVTQGFGGSWYRRRERVGRVIGWVPLAASRDLRTVVRSGVLLRNDPKAVRGDSGGPIIVDGQVVAVQSLIMDPFGVNLGIAAGSQVAPHRGRIERAVRALAEAY